jgi:transcriptional regulator with XRE-family HTH domain
MPEPRQSVKRTIRRQTQHVTSSIAADLGRIRTEIGASQTAVAREAGIDRSHLTRIEAGQAHPSLDALVAIATAMGAEVSVRLYAGRGPKLADRHSARMIELTLRELAPVWRPHLEVRVDRPVRGYIDVVLERGDTPLLVATEYESMLPGLEQQTRWASEKAAAVASSDLVGPGPPPEISKLLVLRSTERTRGLARTFESTLQTAYPARTREAVDAIRTGAIWPGPAIVWIRIEGDRVELLDGPPRGVTVGR